MRSFVRYQLRVVWGDPHEFLRSRCNFLDTRDCFVCRLSISGESNDGFSEGRAHLFDRSVVSRRIELSLVFDNEETTLRYLCQCIIRPLKIHTPLANRQLADRNDLSTSMDLGRHRLGYRMDVEQPAGRLQEAVDLLKGMNHAPVFHSAQGPGQDHDVEGSRWAGGREVFKPDVVKLDTVLKVRRQMLPRQ